MEDDAPLDSAEPLSGLVGPLSDPLALPDPLEMSALPLADAEPTPRLSRGELGVRLAELRPRMISVALRFAPNRHAAEDVVQNAYEKVVRNIARFRHHARLSTWIHRIVVNEALMWLRSEKRRARYFQDLPDWESLERVEPAPDPAQRMCARQRVQRVRAGIEALPAAEREVLQQCALGELSYEEFCARQGTRPAAAKSRAFRARRRLRASLADF